MSPYLLDSDIIIWVLRQHQRTLDLVQELTKAGVPACSPLSVIEVLIGAKPEEEADTRRFLEALQSVPVDMAVAERAAEYTKAYQDRKHPDFADAIIAATAVVHGLTLVTYNRKHYPMPEIRLYP
ncbi:MAG: type II toxin-antitoxin system VapC family toxin, partial [Candidatus Bipolaricaulia bacterium]